MCSRGVLIEPLTFYVLSFLQLYDASMRDGVLTSYWCCHTIPKLDSSFILYVSFMTHRPRTSTSRFRCTWSDAKSVPMARGKHLFPCRTQKLSLVAVTILGVHPWENSTVPNYTKAIRIGWLLSFNAKPGVFLSTCLA